MDFVPRPFSWNEQYVFGLSVGGDILAANVLVRQELRELSKVSLLSFLPVFGSHPLLVFVNSWLRPTYTEIGLS